MRGIVDIRNLGAVGRHGNDGSPGAHNALLKGMLVEGVSKNFRDKETPLGVIPNFHMTGSFDINLFSGLTDFALSIKIC